METSRERLEALDGRARVVPLARRAARSEEAERPVGRVVVGVDGSLGVLNAVSWAAAEAARRGADLDLVQIRPGEPPPGHGRAVLHRALGTAAAVAPGVAMTVTRRTGAAGPGLVTDADRAGLLVVGGRRRTDAGPSGDRTVVHVLHHARCPVVVVPPRRTGAWASTPSARPVVAGVSVRDHAVGVDLALDLALDAACRRRAPLVVVGEHDDASDRTCRGLASRARALGALWFGTTVDLVDALRDAGRRAQLIVLGPRSGPPDDGHAPGARAVDVLAGRCPCPLMVAAPTGTRATGGGAAPPPRTPASGPGSPRWFSPLPAVDGGVAHERERPDLAEPTGV